MRTTQKKIQQLAGPWLKCKKTTVSDYVNFKVAKGLKFDELALLIFSIATKYHIGVFHRDNSMWTTNASGDMDECEVLLLNRGNLMLESVEMIEVEAAKTVAEKKDPTYNPDEEEDDNPDEEEEEDNPDDNDDEEEEEEEEEEENEGGGDGDEDVEGGEKTSLAIAVVPPLPRQTPKKETVVMQFNTLS